MSEQTSEDGAVSDADAARAVQSRRVRIALAAGVLLVVFLLLFLWRGWRMAAPPPAAPPPTAVDAVEVVAQTVPNVLNAVGAITAVQQVMLTPQAAGDVTEIHFREGAAVRAGALLVQLNDEPERADLAAAKAQAEFARLQLARAVRLVESGAESREILQQRQAEDHQARAAVDQIVARIHNLQVDAPFPGVLGVRRVSLGQYLKPGDPVVTLTDMNRVYADFTLPQQELADIRPGASVTVATDSFPGRIFHGKVVTVEPQISGDTRNVLVRALLPNGDHALRPGMYVTAGLVLAPRAGALVLPLTAVVTSSAGSSAVVLRGNTPHKEGKADMVPLEIGRRIGSSVVVTKGLKAGDIVVENGQIRVQPGATLKVVKLRNATLAATPVAPAATPDSGA